ncbi:MAG: transposase [Oscillospiraceae bacterium]
MNEKKTPVPRPCLWTNSYFVSTVGGAPLSAIKQYIENQTTSQRQEGKKRGKSV